MERKHIVVGNTFLCRKIYGLLKIILRLRVYTIDNREKKKYENCSCNCESMSWWEVGNGVSIWIPSD